MKALLSIILLFTVAAASAQSISTTTSSDTTLASLKKRKAAIDQYRKTHKKQVLLFAKVAGKKNLVKVINMKWPDNVEYSYNVLKNENGQIIYIMQSPFSESGDWDIEYEHYFNEQGNTIAFYTIESIFAEEDVVRQTLLKYYNSAFKSLAQIKGFTDKDFHPIKKNKDGYDFRNYKYTIYKNLDDCLKAYHIQL